MKRTAMILLLLSFCVGAYAATNALTTNTVVKKTVFELYPNSIGFSGGIPPLTVSGIGISFRHWIDSFGYQITGGILYTPPSSSSSYGSILDYSVSLQVMKSLMAAEFTEWLYSQLYLLAAVRQWGYILPMSSGSTVTYGPYYPNMTIGAGFGIELGFSRHYSLCYEMGYSGAFCFVTPPSSISTFYAPQFQMFFQATLQYRY